MTGAMQVGMTMGRVASGTTGERGTLSLSGEDICAWAGIWIHLFYFFPLFPFLLPPY